MNACPDEEALSEYLDREAPPERARAVAAHLSSCAACARRLRGLEVLKASVRAAGAAPALPGDLRAALLRRTAAPSFMGSLRAELRAALSRPAAAFSMAVCAAFLLWSLGRRSLRGERGVEVPADLLMAAHDQYALTLPLAPTESILAGMPVRLAGGSLEASDVR